MNLLKVKFKTIARKILLSETFLTLEIQHVLHNLEKTMFQERTFYYGQKRLRANCLQMESAPGTAEMVINLLQKYPQNSKILDFGCGQHQSQYLRSMGYNVFSCDIFDFNLPNYTKLEPKNNRLPFSDKKFDVVIASEVLEHLESPFQILNELVRTAKTAVIITSPNPASLKSRSQFKKTGFLYWFAPENFAYHISPVFHWQVELYCQRHNIVLDKMLGNHESFGLGDKKNIIEQAEALVYEIKIG